MLVGATKDEERNGYVGLSGSCLVSIEEKPDGLPAIKFVKVEAVWSEPGQHSLLLLPLRWLGKRPLHATCNADFDGASKRTVSRLY